jgi:hypothetical protein
MKKVLYDESNIAAELRFSVHIMVHGKMYGDIDELNVGIPVGSAEELANLLTCYSNKEYSDLFSNQSFDVDYIEEVDFDCLILKGSCEEVASNLFIAHRLSGSAQININKVVGESAEKLSRIREIIHS